MSWWEFRGFWGILQRSRPLFVCRTQESGLRLLVAHHFTSNISFFCIGFIIDYLIYGFGRQGLAAFAAVIDFRNRGNTFKESKAIRPDADGGAIIHLLEFVAIGADSCDDYVE